MAVSLCAEGREGCRRAPADGYAWPLPTQRRQDERDAAPEMRDRYRVNPSAGIATRRPDSASGLSPLGHSRSRCCFWRGAVVTPSTDDSSPVTACGTNAATPAPSGRIPARAGRQVSSSRPSDLRYSPNSRRASSIPSVTASAEPHGPAFLREQGGVNLRFASLRALLRRQCMSIGVGDATPALRGLQGRRPAGDRVSL